jgi:hypothetical protein
MTKIMRVLAGCMWSLWLIGIQKTSFEAIAFCPLGASKSCSRSSCTLMYTPVSLSTFFLPKKQNSRLGKRSKESRWPLCWVAV